MPATKRNHKPKRRKYYQIIDGEEILIDTRDIQYEQCCDCALVHKLRYKVIDAKTISVKVWRIDRETNRLRKQHKVKAK